MKVQWTLIFALIFALITAIFAVANVNSVEVNYIFGKANLPLILVIVGSTLLGGLIVGMFGIIRQYRLQKKIKNLNKQIAAYQEASERQAELVVPEDRTAMQEETVDGDVLKEQEQDAVETADVSLEDKPEEVK